MYICHRVHGFSYVQSLYTVPNDDTSSGQHVRTFDGHHHQFLGSCSYLLAKDFDGEDFEIIGVYQSGLEAGRGGVAGLEAVRVHGPKADVTIHVSGTVTNPVIQPPARVS